MGLVVLPVVIGLVALTVAALILPTCAIGGFAWSNACPRATTVRSQRLDDLAAVRAALEAEVAALQRRIAALPACDVPESGPAAEPVVAPVAATPTPRPPARPPDIPRDRWEERDLSLLEGCWNLDSDYAVQDVHTRVVTPVSAWQMCFEGNGRGRQTLRFQGGVTCSGAIQSTFNAGGNLEIDDIANVACTNRSIIFRRISTCSLNPQGRADCVSRTVARPSQAHFTLRR